MPLPGKISIKKYKRCKSISIIKLNYIIHSFTSAEDLIDKPSVMPETDSIKIQVQRLEKQAFLRILEDFSFISAAYCLLIFLTILFNTKPLHMCTYRAFSLLTVIGFPEGHCDYIRINMELSVIFVFLLTMGIIWQCVAQEKPQQTPFVAQYDIVWFFPNSSILNFRIRSN